jgi:hypothetical protein
MAMTHFIGIIVGKKKGLDLTLHVSHRILFVIWIVREVTKLHICQTRKEALLFYILIQAIPIYRLSAAGG